MCVCVCVCVFMVGERDSGKKGKGNFLQNEIV